jgi:serine/threonine-protein kinase
MSRGTSYLTEVSGTELRTPLPTSGESESTRALFQRFLRSPAMVDGWKPASVGTHGLRAHLQAGLAPIYSIEAELDGGGMSRVFIATDEMLGRRVVLKALSPQIAGNLSIERFKREIGVAARLHHPHLVPLLSAGDAAGVLFYTMPFVEGESLRERLGRDGSVPVPESIRLLKEVARGLGYAHERGVVHRDIKPENILLTGGSAAITDFGIAKALADSGATQTALGSLADWKVTRIGESVGTPAYMAPEQAAGDPVGESTDVYSLGVVAYEMLSGVHPFAEMRTFQQLLTAHLVGAPEPIQSRVPDLPPALVRFVESSMAKSRDDRPRTGCVTALLEEAAAQCWWQRREREMRAASHT